MKKYNLRCQSFVEVDKESDCFECGGSTPVCELSRHHEGLHVKTGKNFVLTWIEAKEEK